MQPNLNQSDATQSDLSQSDLSQSDLAEPKPFDRRWMPALLIAPFFLWGTAMVAMKGTIPHTTPLFMAGVRLLPAGVLVLIAAALTTRFFNGAIAPAQPKGWTAWLWIALFGLVDGTLFQGFLAEGLMRTGAGLGSVMIDSQPIAVALMARFLFGEQVGLWGWLGLGFGIGGISLLGLPQDWIWGTAARRCEPKRTGRSQLTGATVSKRRVADADGSAVDGSWHGDGTLCQPPC